jgi:hypothetical protein
MARKGDDEDLIRSNLEDNAIVDPRRIRKKQNYSRNSDLLKGFDSVKVEQEKEASYLIAEQNYQKKLDKRTKELEYVGFDHDRKSRGKSPMIPALKGKLVPNDLKTPEIEKEEKTKKVTLAKFVRSKMGLKKSTKTRKK